MTIRRATIKDTPAIIEIMQPYVDDDVLLPVPIYRLYERIRDFYVAEEDGTIIGCGSLMIMWHDLAEIRSLVVRKGCQRGGAGRALVEKLIDEARGLGIAKVFALTYRTDFFIKVGFQVVAKETLPHKVWKDCTYCAKFTHCNEVAVERVLFPELVSSTEMPEMPGPTGSDLLMPEPAKP